MTVIPLAGRDRLRVPANPPRTGLSRRRPLTTSAGSAALTVTFDVTLVGDSRYSDALAILDTLRGVTDRLGTGTVDVAPGPTVEDSNAEARPDQLPVVPFAQPAFSAQALAEDGSVQIMPDARMVVVAGEQVVLTRMEFDLLVFLAEHRRRVFFRSQLLNSVWGHEHAGPRTVDVHIRRLRAKLGDALITTVRGVGYGLAGEAIIQFVREGSR